VKDTIIGGICRRARHRLTPHLPREAERREHDAGRIRSREPKATDSLRDEHRRSNKVLRS
jgi:hypothetical protein